MRFFQEFVASRNKGKRQDTHYWQRLEQALDNGLIFQSVSMRLPVRKYLEERGWVEKTGKDGMKNEQFQDRKCLKIEKRFKVRVRVSRFD